MASQGKHERKSLENKKKILLVACGSFNPITNMHLRMFEVAKDALEQLHPCNVVGVISPVNDKYSHKELAPAKDRIEMIRLALETSDWIKVDTWEANQDTWLETAKILQHMREVAISHFCAGDENDNEATYSSKRRRIRDINKNVERTDGSGVFSSGDIEIRLLCGADVIQSFAVPDLWKPIHIEEIVRDFGLVVCNRVGYDLNKFIYEFDTLSSYKNNILIITDWITNEISSTKIRRALKRGESVKYLLQDSVIDYIHHKQLYNAKITKSGVKTICSETIGNVSRLMLTSDRSVVHLKEEAIIEKLSIQEETCKSEFNACSQCHLYTCCCCWFLEGNPLLDVGDSVFKHHHHYHLPPHPHPSLHSNIHHCHPMSLQTEQSRWTQDLADTLPENEPLGHSIGTDAYCTQSINNIPGGK